MRESLKKTLSLSKTNGVNGHAQHAPFPEPSEAKARELEQASLEEKAKSRAPEKGVVIPSQALWAQGSRVGGGITPAQISSIIRSADMGSPAQLIDLANESRQADSHLQAVLGTNEESIAGCKWQVVAPEFSGKLRAKDKRVAQWVEQVLRGCDDFATLIAHLAGAYYYGYAVAEIVFRKEAGRLIPARFVFVAPRRFAFRSEDGKLVLWDSGSTQVDIASKYPNKFIIAQPRVNGDVPNREGLCRPLVWMSIMRRWVLGDWVHTGEMSWKPYRIGTYKQATAGAKDRDDLELILRKLTTDFTAVKSDACEIDIEWPAGTQRAASTHGELANVLANEMSKAVLGQTETTQSSSSSGYAQAKVHDGVRRDIRDSRARQIATIISRDLIAAIVRVNFGDSVAVPRFEFVTSDAPDLVAFSSAVKTFVDAGLKIPQKWVRDEAGIPEPTEGEPVLESEKNPEPGDAADAPEKPTPPPSPSGGGEDKPDAAQAPSDEGPEPEDA